MKDLEYFLRKEDEYMLSHPNNSELIYDDQSGGFIPRRYPDDFLQGGWLHKFSEGNHSHEVEMAKAEYDLTEVEILILHCFLGNFSYCFRDDYYAQYGEIPEIAEEMQSVLGKIIEKAPVHSSGLLYRFLKMGDISEVNPGDIIEPKCSFTTTNEDWNQDNNCYVITPLPPDKTNAHDLYKIWNHGNENQVNFVKGTKFQVTRIEVNPRNGLKRIYMSELQNE